MDFVPLRLPWVLHITNCSIRPPKAATVSCSRGREPVAGGGIHALTQAPPERFAEASGRGYPGLKFLCIKLKKSFDSFILIFNHIPAVQQEFWVNRCFAAFQLFNGLRPVTTQKITTLAFARAVLA